MPVGRAWYVRGQKLAFPYGERWVSGPFDESSAAHDEARRLRPFYPDATLSVRLRSGKTLPEVKPRTAAPGEKTPQFDLSTVAGRREAAEAIRSHVVERLGLQANIEDWDGEPDVDCRAPGLLGTIWLGHTPAAPMPIISWVADSPRRLVAVPGAWAQEYPHRKATSEPRDWAELFAMLETGLLAAIDGRAFELEEIE